MQNSSLIKDLKRIVHPPCSMKLWVCAKGLGRKLENERLVLIKI